MSQFSELAKVWKKLIFEWILLLKIQTNWQKSGLQGKISNAFTLGLMGNATIVTYKP
jgi:hypothetical protein